MKRSVTIFSRTNKYKSGNESSMIQRKKLNIVSSIPSGQKNRCEVANEKFIRMKNPFFLFAFTLMLIAGCKNNAAGDDSGDVDPAGVLTPVTVTTGSNESLKDSVALNAISSYLLSADIKANINGYINNVRLHLGDPVSRGQTLFILQTKESKSLGNTIDKLDPTFKFSGISVVKSTAGGYITMLNHQAGDYVQDGEVLATITDKNSFGFMLNLPFEYRSLVKMGQAIDILLPDSTRASGQVYRIMPRMDSVSQTQQVFVKTAAGNLPSGLIAKVVLIKQEVNGFTLPKQCVYADDSQQDFWVMKLLNDSVAVKIPVKKGLESSSSVAIVSPEFNPADRFVMQGGYGLSDTAKISIQK